MKNLGLFLCLPAMLLASQASYSNTAPIIIGGDGSYVVAQDASVGTVIGRVEASDFDGDTLTFALDQDSDSFQIDPESGELSVASALNRANGTQLSLPVTVSDGLSEALSLQTIYILPAKGDVESKGLTAQRWNGVSGSSISALTSLQTYPDSPSTQFVVSRSQVLEPTGSSYGQRLIGYLRPSISAEYEFWISSDDQSQLFISRDLLATEPSGPIASVERFTNVEQWQRYSSQKSAPIHLVSGQVYRFEVLHKEGGGGDHVSVAMREVGDTSPISENIIDSSELLTRAAIDLNPPSKVQTFASDFVSASLVRLSWSKSDDDIGVASYLIMRDELLLATIDAEQQRYLDSTVQADTQYTYTIIAQDEFGNRSQRMDLLVDTSISVNAIEAALESGDASLVVNALELVEAAIETIESSQAGSRELKKQLFNLDDAGLALADGSSLTNVSWDPTHDAAIFESLDSNNVGVLQSNAVTQASRPIITRDMVIAGQGTNTARYMAMMSNPMRHTNSLTEGSQFNQFFRNSLAWLTERDDLNPQPFKVVLSHLSQSFYFQDEIRSRAWLEREYPGQVSFNDRNQCEQAQLAACLSDDTDLLIISQVDDNGQAESIRETVKQALERGIAVLYVHHDGNLRPLGRELLSLMSVTYVGDNTHRRLKTEDFDVREILDDFSAADQSLLTMLRHFRDQTYTFDWSACVDENCSPVVGFNSDFLEPASRVRALLRSLDQSRQNIFASADKRLSKLLVLIGDHFRQDVIYPMGIGSTPDDEFMRAFYADHATYNYRSLNAAMPNMGNFSRSDFSHISPTTRNVDLLSKRRFKATGAYALPGQTFRVTRNDDSDVGVKVFVNTIRDGATHVYARNGYLRPRFLQSAAVEIKLGETIELTHAYGGPIQLGFDTNDLPVSVTIENIGEHAYWEGSNYDQSFAQKLDANEFDWAELVTPGFQVHSKLDRMIQTVTDPRWGSPEAAAAATQQYVHNLPHVLAGFQGPGIDEVPEIHQLAEDKGWTINNIDIVKHMNADQALCGYGCSGNPYDAYWVFDPIGHGDIHEVGHGLQAGNGFKGWENHSMTNHYSYYSKSRYHEATGDDPTCQNLRFEQNFDLLQASINQQDPTAYLEAELWDKSSWNEQASAFIQMMMAAQHAGAVENGWHVRAMLHIMQREFNRARRNENLWAEKRESLGFSSYTLAQANAADINDFYLIAFSVVTGFDYSDYLDMWGLRFSDRAKAQLASLELPMLQRLYFMSSANGFCKSKDNGDFLAKVPVPVDGNQVWPSEVDDDNDGLWSAFDNCEFTENFDQANNDGDVLGDACDIDDDNDKVEDSVDNCSLVENPSQLDTDEDLFGDACDADKDADLVLNELDNCPLIANTDQADSDQNGVGNLCQVDEELCFPIVVKSEASQESTLVRPKTAMICF